MATKCPRCGAENPDHAQYCNLCFGSIGFQDPEYTHVAEPQDGYMEQYPSSFESAQPPPAVQPPQDRPGTPQQGEPMIPLQGERAPVDVGTYGTTSGYEQEQAYGQFPPAEVMPPQQPLDIGSYGSHSGASWEGQQPPPGPPPAGYTGPYEAPRVRSFNWSKGILTCLYVAVVAAFISIGLELLFSMVGLSFAAGGNFTMASVWIIMALLIPVVICGFYPAYRMEAYGWAMGLIAVALWAFIFRPLYYAVFGWILSSRFDFMMSLNKVMLAFIFFLFLPLGAFVGWLAEKRATTGLWF